MRMGLMKKIPITTSLSNRNQLSCTRINDLSLKKNKCICLDTDKIKTFMPPLTFILFDCSLIKFKKV